MPETTRIIPPTPDAAITEAGHAAIPHLWFWLLGVGILVTVAALAVLAARREPPETRGARVRAVLADCALFFGAAYGAVASWTFRSGFAHALDGLVFGAMVLYYWIAGLPPAERVWIFIVFAMFLYELRLYHKLARFAWRRVFPDLCRRSSASGEINPVGRLYATTALPGGGFRVSFVPHGGRWYDWIFARHSLDVGERLVEVDRFRVAFIAPAIERDLARPRAWRIRAAAQPGFRFGGESASAIMEHSLEDNKLASQHGVDGNPYVLAQRAARHRGTHIAVRSRRASPIRSTRQGSNGAQPGSHDAS